MFKVTIRVVASMASEHRTYEQVVAYTVRRMEWYTGGVTVDAISTGHWRNANSDMVSEIGQNIWTLTDNEEDIEKLKEIARRLKVIGNQDCVLFMVEEIRGEFV